MYDVVCCLVVFFFKQKTAYEMRISDWSSDVCSSDLPPGFSYRSFAWVGDPLVGGGLCPDAHDGMGVIGVEGGIVTLIRNHEVVRASGAFAPASASYD